MVIAENEFVTDGKDLESDDVCYMHGGEIVQKNYLKNEAGTK